MDSHYLYRVAHLLANLGWVDFDLVGRYCSYLLPKQDGGTSQIYVNITQSARRWATL